MEVSLTAKVSTVGKNRSKVIMFPVKDAELEKGDLVLVRYDNVKISASQAGADAAKLE